MAKKWFDEFEIDNLRQKKCEAPFKPNTDMLDSLVERSYMHSVPDVPRDLDPQSLLQTPLIRCSTVNKSSLIDDCDED